MTMTSDATLVVMFEIIQGSLEPDIVFPLVDSAGAALDLTGSTDLKMRWKKSDGSVVEAALVEEDFEEGTLKRVWASGDTDLVGIHECIVTLLRANGELQKFGPFYWWVRRAF
jgi:hypothetical protein